MNTSPEFFMLVNVIYPIGHIYKSTKDTNPGTFIPGTTWELIKGTFLYNSADAIVSSNRTGGSTTSAIEEIPAHIHKGDIYNRTSYGKVNVENYGQASSVSPGNYARKPTKNTTSVGNGTSPTHNNMPPYRAVYMWRRVT